MKEKLKNWIEKYSFGVCSYLADRMGLAASRVRLYFIYTVFVGLGSPIIAYLAIAFWLNIKKYLRKSKNWIFE
jgi:phage shock protein PspC (stress-responsive transcriptional regulator)